MNQALLLTHARDYPIPIVVILSLLPIKIKKMKIKEDLEDILNDHKSHLIELLVESHPEYKVLVDHIEREHERMLTEVNELLGSSYE